LIFDHAKSNCYSCHLDIHKPTVGQFDINGKTDCSRCHGTDFWKTVNFDHNSSRFKLDGSHAIVECNECHKEVIDEKGKYIHYKFKNIECASCHS
jgi:hydrogenase maturation factor HypF (carbamoyltransferase family)